MDIERRPAKGRNKIKFSASDLDAAAAAAGGAEALGGASNSKPIPSAAVFNTSKRFVRERARLGPIVLYRPSRTIHGVVDLPQTLWHTPYGWPAAGRAAEATDGRTV